VRRRGRPELLAALADPNGAHHALALRLARGAARAAAPAHRRGSRDVPEREWPDALEFLRWWLRRRRAADRARRPALHVDARRRDAMRLSEAGRALDSDTRFGLVPEHHSVASLRGRARAGRVRHLFAGAAPQARCC
jgi:hypothetical protein